MNGGCSEEGVGGLPAAAAPAPQPLLMKRLKAHAKWLKQSVLAL